jgi:hypothetical protein
VAVLDFLMAVTAVLAVVEVPEMAVLQARVAQELRAKAITEVLDFQLIEVAVAEVLELLVETPHQVIMVMGGLGYLLQLMVHQQLELAVAEVLE